jgi:hypothetical protein
MARVFILVVTIFLAIGFSANGSPARATEILIGSNDFGRYFKEAQPGDTFAIYPGTYQLKSQIKIDVDGTKDAPITLRPVGNGKVTIEVINQAAFKLRGANWIIENLEFVGACAKHNHCEHGLHIARDADNTIIRNNRFIDFNAAIKGNGELIDDRQYFPDHVLIEGNTFYNNTPRNTGAPVVPIDVVGGRHWIIRDNFFADFAKGAGNKVSYAAFLKGNSDNGLFERNVVMCEWRHRGGVRVGLSLGGGGTNNPQFCQGRSCKIEHYKGVIRSNLIMNCPTDVGIYLNNAASTKVENNTIINTLGVDVRFNGSFATIANNIIQGRIKDRDGGRHRELGNLIEEDLEDIFPRAAMNDLTPEDLDDFRARYRDGEPTDLCTGKAQPDWMGAFNHPMACTIRDLVSKYVPDSP